MQKGQVLIFLIVGILILAAVGGFLFYSNYSNNHYKTNSQSLVVTSPTPQPILSPSLSPSSDETANWKTYTSTKYGYSIKYPSDWKEVLHCEGGAANSDYICFLSPDFEESQVGAIAGSLNGGSLWIDGQDGIISLGPPDKFCTANNQQLKLSECQKITVSGKEAWERRYEGYNYKEIGIINNNKFILDIRVVFSPKSEKDILNISDQILSTFKFTQ